LYYGINHKLNSDLKNDSQKREVMITHIEKELEDISGTQLEVDQKQQKYVQDSLLMKFPSQMQAKFNAQMQKPLFVFIMRSLQSELKNPQEQPLRDTKTAQKAQTVLQSKRDKGNIQQR
jgi:hypothetical protein